MLDVVPPSARSDDLKWSEPLVVPNFGTMSRIRDIWLKCPYFVPNLEYFGLKIGTLAIFIHICTTFLLLVSICPDFVPILLISILWSEVDCDRVGNNSEICSELSLFNCKIVIVFALKHSLCFQYFFFIELLYRFYRGYQGNVPNCPDFLGSLSLSRLSFRSE